MVRFLICLWLLFSPLSAQAMSLHIQLKDPVAAPVVGQMILITLRGMFDRHITNEKLVIPPQDSFDWIQTRADDWRDERIEGKSWRIFERHLAIWPRRAGMLQFGPIQHDLTIIGAGGKREQMILKAEPLELSIAPHPGAGQGWKFAAHDFEITEDLSTDPARLPDGGTVTRRITLRALGSLPEHLPPRPVVSEPWLITFAAPPQRHLHLTPEGPLAEAIWEWQFRPEHGEPGILPPVTIPWFNSQTHRLETAEIPPLTIGYASFYTGQRPTGQFAPAHMMVLAAGFMAMFLAGLGLIWLNGRPLPPAAQRRLRARLSVIEWWRLWRARARGDLRQERAQSALLGLSAARQAALDRQLYGK